MIGPGGIELVEPKQYAGDRSIIRKAYEDGRRYGRWEADHAICWDTTCVSCAKSLDVAASAHFAGERAGLTEALAVVQDMGSNDPAVQEVIDTVRAKLARLLLTHYDRNPADRDGHS